VSRFSQTATATRVQQTAGQFAPPPPVPGVGPGALADPHPFLEELARAGIDARVETELLGFDFDDFASAWNALAGVTTAMLPQERQREAKAAVRAVIWPNPSELRHFSNKTQFSSGCDAESVRAGSQGRREQRTEELQAVRVASGQLHYSGLLEKFAADVASRRCLSGSPCPRR